MSQPFKADDIQESRTISGTVVNVHGKRPSPTLGYTWKIVEARRCREQGTIKDEKRATVS